MGPIVLRSAKRCQKEREFHDSMPRASKICSLDSLQPERVCLIKPSSMGDVVHALPVLARSARALAEGRDFAG